MEHHYFLQTAMLVRGAEFLCPFGAICTEGELNDTLKRAQVFKYKIKQVDDDPIPNWENAEWTSIA
jgi:hypothetical protein